MRRKTLISPVLMTAAVAASASVQAQQKPNIVLFMVDDMGWRDEPLFTQNAPLRSGKGSLLEGAIREGDWKLIYSYKTGLKALYNICLDIGEEHNLVAEQPKLVRRLSRHLGKRLRVMKAQRPINKATGQPCPWPDEQP